jgi:hypothetical protein
LVLQQYGSAAHTFWAHELQVLTSLTPDVQTECAQLDPAWQVPAEVHTEPVAQVPHWPPQPSGPHCLPVQAGVQVPPHDWPQIELTSPTQTLSHRVLQQ